MDQWLLIGTLSLCEKKQMHEICKILDAFPQPRAEGPSADTKCANLRSASKRSALVSFKFAGIF